MLQKRRIRIELNRPAKDKQVPGEIGDEEEDHRDARHRHGHLLADGCSPESHRFHGVASTRQLVRSSA
jgi:hypothetical protein